MRKKIAVIFILLLFVMSSFAGNEWFQFYKNGVKALKTGNYQLAVANFQKTMKVKQRDKKKIRTYGMHFIEYYPHREIGIAYYYLGDLQKADQHLRISMQYAPSNRAQEYLSKLNSGATPPKRRVQPQKNIAKSVPAAAAAVPKKVSSSKVKLVGERMSIAIFPFETMGSAGNDLGNIVFDKLLTALFNQKRFKVIERNQLEKILDEQKLGMTGVIDASTAAELGKGIGVDAIILGSVSLTRSGAISVDARAIDTESATIITAHDAYSGNFDPQTLKSLVERIAVKFVQSFPLVEGLVIQKEYSNIMLDMGSDKGLKKGMKCVIYREGAEIKHPVTGQILGKDTKILGEISLNDVYEKYTSGSILSNGDGSLIQVGDKFITK